MRTAYLLPAALLLLAACDSADPAVDQPEPIASTFEARITTASSERTVSGAASNDLSDERGGTFGSFGVGDDDRTLTAIELTADATGEAFVFVGATTDALASGARYDIGFRVDEDTSPQDSVLPIEQGDTFLAAYFTQSEGAKTIGLGSGGSIAFATVTDDALVGTFRFETRTIVVSEGGVRRTEPATIEGTFTVDRRERPDRDGTR